MENNNTFQKVGKIVLQYRFTSAKYFSESWRNIILFLTISSSTNTYGTIVLKILSELGRIPRVTKGTDLSC